MWDEFQRYNCGSLVMDKLFHPYLCCALSQSMSIKWATGDPCRLCIKELGHDWFRSWASCHIRNIAGCACAGNAGNVFPRRRLQRKPLVSDPGMHHGTCVTHVPRCMSGSLTRACGENVPGIPGACAPTVLRIWQESHGLLPVRRQVIT